MKTFEKVPQRRKTQKRGPLRFFIIQLVAGKKITKEGDLGDSETFREKNLTIPKNSQSKPELSSNNRSF